MSFEVTGTSVYGYGRNLSLTGGGNDDYAGNEVYSINLASETPAWSKRSVPTQPNGGSLYAAGLTNPAGYAYYWDGRPSSRHTWTSCAQVIDSLGTQGQIVLFGAGAVWGNGNASFPNLDAWDIASEDYSWLNPDPFGSPNAQSPDFTNNGYPIDECVKNADGDVWATNTSQGTLFRVMKWNRATKTWTNAVSVNRNTSASMLFDSTRNRVVLFPTDTGLTGQYFDATDGSGLTSFAWSGTPPGTASRFSGSAWYVPEIDRYVYMPKSAAIAGNPMTLWSINPETWESTQITTTGTAPVVVSSADGFLNFGRRFHYIPAYKGCVCFSHVSANAKFIRLA